MDKIFDASAFICSARMMDFVSCDWLTVTEEMDNSLAASNSMTKGRN